MNPFTGQPPSDTERVLQRCCHGGLALLLCSLYGTSRLDLRASGDEVGKVAYIVLRPVTRTLGSHGFFRVFEWWYPWLPIRVKLEAMAGTLQFGKP